MTRTHLMLIPAVLAAASCSSAGDKQAITMTVIGTKLTLSDPNRGPISRESALMLGATAQGLVAFDADGQIEPALAERWIMTDDGLSVIFRIRRTKWSDGRPVTSADVAARLRSVMAPSSRNALRPLLSGVDRILGMTGQFIEIRLKAPQPDFLQILAQPELALFKTSPLLGSGPYRIHSMRNGVTRLRPFADESSQPAQAVEERNDIRVRSEPASALPGTRCSGGTISGTIVVIAGAPNPSPAP